MTAEQILKEIEALPKTERERLVQCMRKSTDIPQDFIDALDDFKKQRFVSMEIALNVFDDLGQKSDRLSKIVPT